MYIYIKRFDGNQSRKWILFFDPKQKIERKKEGNRLRLFVSEKGKERKKSKLIQAEYKSE